jgi:hypothetical protein
LPDHTPAENEAADLYSLIGTAKLNGINPEASLRRALAAMVLTRHAVASRREAPGWGGHTRSK